MGWGKQQLWKQERGGLMTGSVLSNLLAPGAIGCMSLRNRIVVTAMGVNLAEEDGNCGEQMIAYHAEQARGGAGLIITGATGVALPTGTCLPRQTSISDDRHLAGLSALADAVHADDDPRRQGGGRR